MSFKREGNDKNLLKNLQHRRVSEILGDHIPDDEAMLLSNGSLTCIVCSKRPIFNTIQMLSVHRKGKNHLYELSKYLEEKRDMELKKTKRIQKNYIKTGQIPTESDSKEVTLNFITFSSNFSNRSKQKSCKYGRMPVLDITETCEKIKNNVTSSPLIEPSANAQVRRYLKSLVRKRPLEKTITNLRENYSNEGDQKTEKKPEAKRSEPSAQVQMSEEEIKQGRYNVRLLESGWVKDKNGKWVKDPDVEFDSDEEEPPSF